MNPSRLACSRFFSTRSSIFFEGFLLLIAGMLMSWSWLLQAEPEPFQVIPTELPQHLFASRFLLDPCSNFRAVPEPTVGGWLLQRVEEFLALRLVQRWWPGCACPGFALVRNACWAVLVVLFEDVSGVGVAASGDAGGEVEVVLEADQPEELPTVGFSSVVGGFEFCFELVAGQVGFELGGAWHGVIVLPISITT
jgi:hypothetical protein